MVGMQKDIHAEESRANNPSVIDTAALNLWMNQDARQTGRYSPEISQVLSFEKE
jgi:hypothetical protein